MRMARAKDRNQRQQRHHGVFIRAQGEFAAMEVAQFTNRRMRMAAQIQHLLRKIEEHAA